MIYQFKIKISRAVASSGEGVGSTVGDVNIPTFVYRVLSHEINLKMSIKTP